MMKYNPEWSKLHGWEVFSRNMRGEYKQRTEEGYDIAQYENLFGEIARLTPSDESMAMADALADLADKAPLDPNYEYVEPSDLDGIFAARDGKAPAKVDVDPAAVRDKIRGAWYGRLAGCLLGKPVEGIRTEELIPVLKRTNNYPMNRYITRAELTDEVCEGIRFGLRNRDCYPDLIPNAPVDDDTNYTVLYMKLVERYGKNFTPRNVADWWLAMQPKNAYCTAERVAFVNFAAGIYPPASAVYRNPFREWIGAQIRADFFGYCCPGNPEQAAELAWRDACVSHIKNGIYGEMWVAAMLAYAATVSGIEHIPAVIRAGLSQIPQKSRLYARVSGLLEGWEAGKDEDWAFSYITARWDEHSSHDWCHTISNAEIVTACLLWCSDSYTHAICRAVMCGFDTDCNGATVGSIYGMLCGYDVPGDDEIKKAHYARIQELAASFKEKNGTIICRDLLDGIETDSLPTPTPRTEAYYQERPCVRFVEDATAIVEAYLFPEEENA